MNRSLAEASVALERGDRSTARTILKDALREDPDNAQAWLLLADSVDDPGQRRDCIERVLTLDPDNLRAREALAEQLGLGSATDHSWHLPPAPGTFAPPPDVIEDQLAKMYPEYHKQKVKKKKIEETIVRTIGLFVMIGFGLCMLLALVLEIMP